MKCILNPLRGSLLPSKTSFTIQINFYLRHRRFNLTMCFLPPAKAPLFLDRVERTHRGISVATWKEKGKTFMFGSLGTECSTYTTRRRTELWTKWWRHFRSAKAVPKISMVSGWERSLSRRNRPAIRTPVLPTPALKKINMIISPSMPAYSKLTA